MMHFLEEVRESFVSAVSACFDLIWSHEQVLINDTRKEFSGDYTIVIFPLVGQLKRKPAEIGDVLGSWLLNNNADIIGYETVQGFLNLQMSDAFWLKHLEHISCVSSYGTVPSTGKKVLVEYSSPNTNKPLHLGHIRNILLGWSCANILEANGYEVIRTQVINDRGIAICKSMLAWKKFAQGATPASTGMKGDHFVGDYYVKFEEAFRTEYADFQSSDQGRSIFANQAKPGQEAADFFSAYKNRYFNEHSPLGSEARQMLLDWEAGDPETLSLWKTMNGWVYDGFNETYKQLGVRFDSIYYESDTYLLGKSAVEHGLQKGVFYQEADGSVWVNLEDVGMDRKIVLRSDGTSVYVTQDIGTAQQRYADFGIDKMVYTVADEQDYHFKVLFEILKRLGEPYADGLYHLSYGMVELPSGRMKSREGTVVDADDLMQEVIGEVRAMSEERGEITSLPKEEQEAILHKIGLGALKFFMIKVQPRKKMIFDPRESVDIHGQTGPYIQNAYVRIQSVLRKASEMKTEVHYSHYNDMQDQEKVILRQLLQYSEVVGEAGKQYDPSAIANYCYALAKEFHKFYHDVRILNAETEAAKAFRLQLCQMTGKVLNHGFYLLGIEMPDRM
jgi:arginyl-tRNA synthetase